MWGGGKQAKGLEQEGSWGQWDEVAEDRLSKLGFQTEAKLGG